MGVVYLCRAGETGTVAAVKLIRAEYAANPQLRERLRREVTAARRVPRFCTAPVLDADVDADPPWIATEYVDGPTLDAAVLEHGPLTGTALESFAVGVAVALRAIHEHGVIHRDLKPSNILLSPLGPRVIDFGVARLEGAHTQLTKTGAMIGTPAYMTPEQLRGEPATAAVDVFAWASLVTYAATGRPPFGSGNVPLRSILREPPDLGDLSGPLRELVTAAFAKDPTARPSTAELVDQLSAMAPAITTQVLETATTPPPSRPPTKPRTARRLMVAAAAATVAVVAIAAGVVALVRGDGASAQLQDETRSRQLAAQAREANPVNPQRSMALALDAWAAAPTAEARGVLLSAYAYPYHGQLGTEPGGISVAVAPDGATVAVGHGDGTVQLWDVATRQPIGEPLAGHTKFVSDVAFSPDGTLLATASTEQAEDTQAADGVRVWDVASGELIQPLPGLASVAWLPDGGALVSLVARVGAGDALELGFEVWDVHTGQVLNTIPTDELGLDVAVSRDGAWLAAGYGDGTAEVRRLDDGSVVAELVTAFAPGEEQTEGGVPVTVAFSPQGDLATVPNDGAGEIQIWPLPEADEPRSLTEGEARAGGRLTFTSDGFLLATGAGHPVQWWEPRAGWNWGEYRGFQGTPLDVDASADGKLVAAAGSGGPTTLWQRATYFLPHPNSVLDLAYDPAGDRFATAGADGVIRIWDAATTTMVGTSVHTGQTRSLAYAPDGSLASTSTDGTVRIHEPDGEPRAELAVDEGYEAHDAAFSPDGSLLAVTAAGSEGGAAGLYQVYLWETGPVRLRGVVDLDDGFPSVPVFTPDGSRLLVAAYTSSDPPSDEPPQRSELRGWRTDDLVESDREDLGAQQAVHIAVGPDGDTLAVAGTNRDVELRSLSGDRPARTLANHPATVREVAFSPDGRTLATVTTEEDAVRLWDVETGEPVASLAGHVDTPNAVAFSPDGRTLASASADGMVALWTTDPDHAIARICQALASTSEPFPHPLCGPTGD